MADLTVGEFAGIYLTVGFIFIGFLATFRVLRSSGDADRELNNEPLYFLLFALAVSIIVWPLIMIGICSEGMKS